MCKIPVISLFTGAGGLDLGLEEAGFHIAVSVDNDPVACETIRRNRPFWNVIERDIEELSTSEILADSHLEHEGDFILVGGPPCQPFSKSGYWVNGRTKGLEDPRAKPLRAFLRVLREARPKAYVLENVFGLAYKVNQEARSLIKGELDKLGYSMTLGILDAADYGVPQHRERVFIVGARDGFTVLLPRPTHGSANSKRYTLLSYPISNEPPPSYVTAGDAIGDLGDQVEAKRKELEVGGKWGHLLREIPPGDNYLFLTERRGHPNPIFRWRSRYWSFLLKLSPNRPSWTIQAQPGPYIGPFHWENRRLTLLELKRLMTFPDDWELAGSRTDTQRQLGNAVPPLMARAVGLALRMQLFATEPVELEYR